MMTWRESGGRKPSAACEISASFRSSASPSPLMRSTGQRTRPENRRLIELGEIAQHLAVDDQTPARPKIGALLDASRLGELAQLGGREMLLPSVMHGSGASTGQDHGGDTRPPALQADRQPRLLPQSAICSKPAASA